jgi:hypothetical protein
MNEDAYKRYQTSKRIFIWTSFIAWIVLVPFYLLVGYDTIATSIFRNSSTFWFFMFVFCGIFFIAWLSVLNRLMVTKVKILRSASDYMCIFLMVMYIFSPFGVFGIFAQLKMLSG